MQPKSEKLRAREEEVWRKASHCIAVTERDRQFIAKVIPFERVSLLPNGVDCSRYTPHPAKSEVRLVFIGCLAHPPNLNAAAYFLKHIWPRFAHTDLNFEIIGSGSPVHLYPLLKNEPRVKLAL